MIKDRHENGAPFMENLIPILLEFDVKCDPIITERG